MPVVRAVLEAIYQSMMQILLDGYIKEQKAAEAVLLLIRVFNVTLEVAVEKMKAILELLLAALNKIDVTK